MSVNFVNIPTELKQNASFCLWKKEKRGGRVSALYDGRPEKLADRVERFIKENGYNIKLDYGKFPDRPYDSKAVWGDDTKILEILAARQK